MKILILDSYYPDFLKSVPINPAGTYESELTAVLSHSFGTADFFSRNLRALGHECVDVIANHDALQDLWQREHGTDASASVLDSQIFLFNPDVLFLQDVSVLKNHRYLMNTDAIVAAQCSCPWPGDDPIRRCDVVFTSFPHYIQRIRALGACAGYLPLAFEPSVLEGQQPERDIDISFVGGVGRDSHWKSGTDTLEIVAEAFKERFHWYGYGLDNLPASSALRACYRGPAWGMDMYRIYRRSKIVVNRHGEVAEGYSQNLRNFEATGCGAMLLTEESPNFTKPCDECGHATGAEFFECGREADAYHVASENAKMEPGTHDVLLTLKHRLSNFGRREEIAANGQARTLRDHTYSQRMKTVSEVLTEMLCSA